MPNITSQVVFHPATETIPYAWYSYIPANLNPDIQSYILISGQHGNVISSDYSLVIGAHQAAASGRVAWANQYGYILVTPVIPRDYSGGEGIYSIALDREAFEGRNEFLERADLRVNAILDEYTASLRADGFQVSGKVFIEGFSAGGTFAQRYALLQPERVWAIGAGGLGGVLTLPLAEYDDTQLIWPLGIADFTSVVGKAFSADSYLSIPQFIYVGDQDSNSVMGPGNTEIFTEQQQLWLIAEFGNAGLIRLQNQVAELLDQGFDNLELTVYPGVGHERTQATVTDTFDFFGRVRSRIETGTYYSSPDNGPSAITGTVDGESLQGGSFNDRLTGFAGNDSIDGNGGVDVAFFVYPRSQYTLSLSDRSATVSGPEGIDTLANIERLQFSDVKVAVDLDGAAGTTAKILGAVFGKESVRNESYVGIGLDFLDGGMSYRDLMQLALNVKLGDGFSPSDEVKLLYQNLFGTTPSESDIAYWTDTVTSHQYTAASLAVMAADTPFNTTNINLVGLAQTGIEYSR